MNKEEIKENIECITSVTTTGSIECITPVTTTGSNDINYIHTDQVSATKLSEVLADIHEKLVQLGEYVYESREKVIDTKKEKICVEELLHEYCVEEKENEYLVDTYRQKEIIKLIEDNLK